MKVLVIGGGGREHALVWKLAQSPRITALYCAPGNAGMAEQAICLPVKADDLPGLLNLVADLGIDLVIVGPEAPLVAGLVDRLQAAGVSAFGPTAAAARLEGSKGFTKDLCRRHGIPTAPYARFTEAEVDAAHAYIDTQPGQLVVKADGLAAGKGVILAKDRGEAHAAADQILTERAFGAAGAELVVEAFLEGEEASFFALCDGKTALPLLSAQDHKAVGEGDTGPNTGGMGAYAPAPVLTPERQETVMARIIGPTLDAMAAEGAPFSGVLYAGLMITAEGPQLLEYNVRFGDPECQVLLPLLDEDLLALLQAAADGDLAGRFLSWRAEAAMTVVLASRGYPGRYERGSPIGGLDAAGAVEGVTIFHAGTARQPDPAAKTSAGAAEDTGRLVSNGGRVLNVTAAAPDLAEARRRAYAAIDRIDWPGGFFRRDIGWRTLANG